MHTIENFQKVANWFVFHWPQNWCDELQRSSGKHPTGLEAYLPQNVWFMGLWPALWPNSLCSFRLRDTKHRISISQTKWESNTHTAAGWGSLEASMSGRGNGLPRVVLESWAESDRSRRRRLLNWHFDPGKTGVDHHFSHYELLPSQPKVDYHTKFTMWQSGMVGCQWMEWNGWKKGSYQNPKKGEVCEKQVHQIK